MTEEKAQEIIVIALLITLGSTTAAHLKPTKQGKNLQLHKTIVGGFFAMITCSLLAELDPKAGAYLAILVSGTTFFKYGLPVVESYYEVKGAKHK